LNKYNYLQENKHMNELLFEALPPEQKKKVVFTIGRFSVPTAGHYKVFDKMKEFIRKNPDLDLESSPVVIIVDGEKSGEDKKKNPLTVDERIRFMESSGRATGVKFFAAKNAFVAMGVVRDNGFEPIAIAAGTDRAKSYIEMLDKNFRSTTGDKIEHYVVPGLDRDESSIVSKKNEKAQALDNAIEKLHSTGDINKDEISGSLARHAASLGYLEEFTTIVGLQKKPKLAELLFNKVRKEMGVK
jgi:hypothetical protein